MQWLVAYLYHKKLFLSLHLPCGVPVFRGREAKSIVKFDVKSKFDVGIHTGNSFVRRRRGEEW